MDTIIHKLTNTSILTLLQILVGIIILKVLIIKVFLDYEGYNYIKNVHITVFL